MDLLLSPFLSKTKVWFLSFRELYSIPSNASFPHTDRNCIFIMFPKTSYLSPGSETAVNLLKPRLSRSNLILSILWTTSTPSTASAATSSGRGKFQGKKKWSGWGVFPHLTPSKYPRDKLSNFPKFIYKVLESHQSCPLFSKQEQSSSRTPRQLQAMCGSREKN